MPSYVTYKLTDLKGEDHTTSAVVAYKYFPTDDGASIYVNELGYDRPYDVLPNAMLGILLEEQMQGADAKLAAKTREYLGKYPQSRGDDGSGVR